MRGGLGFLFHSTVTVSLSGHDDASRMFPSLSFVRYQCMGYLIYHVYSWCRTEIIFMEIVTVN